jgi:hypothetical protein
LDGVHGGRRTGYPKLSDPTVVKTMKRKIEYIFYNHSSNQSINNSKIIRKIIACSPLKNERGNTSDRFYFQNDKLNFFHTLKSDVSEMYS